MKRIHPLYAPADAGGAAAADPAGDPASGSGGAGAANGAPPAGGSWRDGLGDELREHPAIAKYDSVDALAKGHVEASDLIGRKGVVPPGDDASPEDLASFYRQALPEHLRAPESGDKYDLGDWKAPDNIGWSDDVGKGVLDAMAGLGLSNQQARGVFAKYAELQQARFEAETARADQAFSEAEKALKTEWGKDFDKKLALADRVVAQAFGEQVAAAKEIKLADGSFLLDNPLLARAFAAIGEAWAEDGVLPAGGGGGFAQSTPQGAQAAIDKIRAEAASDPKHPYNDAKHPEHKAIHKRVLDLQAVVTPGVQS